MPSKNKITTKRGDQGESSLFSGERVCKDCPRLDAIGDLDELTSVLGIARHHVKNDKTKDAILWLQRGLFTVGSEFATTSGKLKKLSKRVDQSWVEEIEQRMEALCLEITTLKGFVVPGGCFSGAHLDHARAIARRCERKAAGLLKSKEINNAFVLVWLNRLSDYLYLMARCEEDKPIYVQE